MLLGNFGQKDTNMNNLLSRSLLTINIYLEYPPGFLDMRTDVSPD